MIQQRWECPACGHEYTTDVVRLPVHCRCGQVDEEGHLIVEVDVDLGHAASRMVLTVGRALGAGARWLSAGRPVRSDAEVEALFTAHCGVCPYFRGATCAHHLCGCQVRDVSGETTSLLGQLISTRLTNKLRLRTESCPDGRW